MVGQVTWSTHALSANNNDNNNNNMTSLTWVKTRFALGSRFDRQWSPLRS